MFNKINKWRKSDYIKNFSALAGGEVIAQVILIIVTPIVSRLYSPDIFGQYEIFKSTSLLLVVLSFMNYDATIYSAKDDKERISSIALNSLIVLIICFFSSIILYFFNDTFVQLIHTEIKKGWFWAIPTYVFFTAMTNMMLIVLTKDGSFYLIAKIKIILSILVAFTQIFFGWLNMGYWGLVYSTIFVQIIAFIIYFLPVYKENRLLFSICRFSDMNSILLNNWRLPLLILPGNFLNNILQNVPVFFLGRIDYQVLGYYSLAKRIIDFPLSFISTSTQRLYIKDLTDEIQLTGLGKVTFMKNLKLFSVIAILLFFGILILTKPVVPLLFGKAWIPAVPYIIVLGLLSSVRFVFGGLSFILILGRAPKLAMLWQLSYAIILVTVFYFLSKLSIKPIWIVLTYVVIGVIFYLIYGLICSKVASSKKYLTLE